MPEACSVYSGALIAGPYQMVGQCPLPVVVGLCVLEAQVHLAPSVSPGLSPEYGYILVWGSCVRK